MYIYLEVENSVIKGEIVSYDENTELWSRAVDDSKIIGVVLEDPTESEGKLIAKILLAGSTLALADRAIPKQGGSLCVANGRVYVDATSSCGLIAPATIGSELREQNDLVLVHLK